MYSNLLHFYFWQKSGLRLFSSCLLPTCFEWSREKPVIRTMYIYEGKPKKKKKRKKRIVEAYTYLFGVYVFWGLVILMDVCGDFCSKDRFYFNLMALGGGPLLFKWGVNFHLNLLCWLLRYGEHSIRVRIWVGIQACMRRAIMNSCSYGTNIPLEKGKAKYPFKFLFSLSKSKYLL